MKNMKKLFSLLLAVVLATLCLTVTAFAEDTDPENFTRITALGADPFGTLYIDDPVNPDTVKWLTISYRINTPRDSKGVPYVGQIYVLSDREPHIVIPYDADKYGTWQKVVVDLTSVMDPANFTSLWTSATQGTDFSKFRFDPLEINRFDDFYSGEVLSDSHIATGDNIDFEYFAFFEKEEDAKAFDGTQDTYASIIDAETISYFTSENGSAYPTTKEELDEDGDTTDESKADESTAEESKADESTAEESKADESTAEESKAEESKADESKADESKADESKADESKTDESKTDESKTDDPAVEEKSSLGIIIAIVAAVVVIAVVAVVVIKKKK